MILILSLLHIASLPPDVPTRISDGVNEKKLFC